MEFPANYTFLQKNVFRRGDYTIVPVRYRDRMDIMRWRNEQIYHLRQNKPLSAADQETYFRDVVARLFEQERPDQVLFSYLEKDVCIGYGGLVHINWTDRNAEISFVMNTALEKEKFAFHWNTYLSLIASVAFDELGMHKIYTYAFDLRPHLYRALEDSGFTREAVLKEHCLFNGSFIDVVIHSKIRPQVSFRPVSGDDERLLFDWANDPAVRSNAVHTDTIPFEQHRNWFAKKLSDPGVRIYIMEVDGRPVGQVRYEKDTDGSWLIDYSIDAQYRGRGYGTQILAQTMDRVPGAKTALVKRGNTASQQVFEKLGFEHASVRQIGDTEYLKFVRK